MKEASIQYLIIDIKYLSPHVGILWILPLLQWKIKILFLQQASSGFYLYCNGKFKFYFYNLKKIKLEI